MFPVVSVYTMRMRARCTSWSDPAVGAAKGETCQHVAQLANIARPGVRGQSGQGLGGDPAIRIDLAEQMACDGIEIGAVAQAGEHNLESIEPIEQVRAETPLGDG